MPFRRTAALLVSLALPSLAAAGVASATPMVPDRYRLGFESLEWDVRAGIAQAPPLLRIAARPRSANGLAYRVVKMAPGAGSGSAVRNALRAAGAEIVGTVPPDAFLVRTKPERLPALSAVRGISWTGELPAAARLAPEIRNRMLRSGADVPVRIRVVLHPEEGSGEVGSFLASVSPGKPRFDPPAVGRGTRVVADVPSRVLADVATELASRPEVAFVEAVHEMKLHNSMGDWVHQTFEADETPLFDRHRLFGCGETISISDTGFDFNSCYFVDETNGAPPVGECTDAPCGAITTNSAERKILAYYNWSGGRTGDDGSCNHGSHTLGSIAGNDAGSAVSCEERTYANPRNADGLAPGAKIIAEELGGGLNYVNAHGGSIYELVDVAYAGGARIHSNSWGGGCCDGGGCLSDCVVAYDSDARDADRVAWDRKDMLVLFSAGNDGGCCDAPNMVGSPGTAKNVLTVGATGHGTSATFKAGYSSSGGTIDGRVKPTVMGQGSSVQSVESDGQVDGVSNCGSCQMSGTSMATPTIAGAAAQVREYLRRGFYPGGAEKAEDALEAPSSALMRALLINGGQHLSNSGSLVPNLAEGWGRVLLEESLYFAGDEKKLFLVDEPRGLETDGTFTTTLAVAAGQPLRITLAWTDYPSTLGTSPALVDDLRLEVVDPSGNVWFQSLDESTFRPEQTKDASRAGDARNTEEQLTFSEPAAGTWMVRVRGVAVPMGPQPFAVVATGGLTACTPPAAPTAVSATVEGRNRVRISWTPGSGAGSFRTFRAGGSCSDPSLSVTTALGTVVGGSFLDTTPSGNVSYCYSVEAVDATSGCTSPRASAALVTATGDCLLAPSFTGAASASALGGGSCGISLGWSPASASCPGFAVRYNVYRDTVPDFTPGAANRVATCLDQATFLDRTDLLSGRTYHYVVRAEDSGSGQGGPCNGGREDGNLARVRATPANDESRANGTFRDRGGDEIALLQPDPEWRLTRTNASEGSFSWHNAPDGELYAPGLCTSLTTPELPLTAGLPHLLSFKIDYNLELRWDGLDVEISSDGGSTWAVLEPDTGYPETLSATQGNGCGWPSTQRVFSGPPGNTSSSDWQPVDVPIPAEYDGQAVRIRFRMTSDGGLELSGVYIDDVSVTNVAMPGACTAVGSAPRARFRAEGWPACPGMPVRFRAESPGATSFSWSFGDGATSTDENPTHTFTGSGPWRVSFTAGNPAGSETRSAWFAPSCDEDLYRPVLAIPGLARSTGSAGSFFESTVWLANPGTSELPLRLTFAPAAGGAAGTISRVDVTLAPRESRVFSDILGSTFGVTGNSTGVVTVRSRAGAVPLASARTFNSAAPLGTYGQYIEAVPLGNAEGLSSADSTIPGLASSDVARSNVGVVNPSDAPITAALDVVDANGTTVGTPVAVSVPARSVHQINGVTAAAGIGGREPFSVRIRAEGPYLAYASRLDNRTSDPIYLPNDLSPATTQWVDGVARAAGAAGTFFRTSLSVSNDGPSAASVTASFTPRGATTAVSAVPFALAAGESRLFTDVLGEMFGNGDSAGALALSSDQPVTAWARTYNDAATGTFGQFIPAVSSGRLLPAAAGEAPDAWLLGLSEDSGFRTNVGLFNRDDEPASVTLDLFAADGTKVGSRSETIPAGGALFLPRHLATLSGGAPVSNGYLALRPQTPGAVYAWASVVDNRSGDAIFVRPMTR